MNPSIQTTSSSKWLLFCLIPLACISAAPKYWCCLCCSNQAWNTYKYQTASQCTTERQYSQFDGSYNVIMCWIVYIHIEIVTFWPPCNANSLYVCMCVCSCLGNSRFVVAFFAFYLTSFSAFVFLPIRFPAELDPSHRLFSLIKFRL